MRILFTLVAISFLASLYWVPYFHDSEGYLKPLACLLFSFSVAFFLQARLWNTPYRVSAVWLALFIVSHGVVLQLINAGPSVHYQHYLLITEVSSNLDILFFGFLGAQFVIVTMALKRHYSAIRLWVQSNIGVSRFIMLLTIYIILNAFPSRIVTSYGIELLQSSIISIIQILTLIAGIGAMPEREMPKLTDRFIGFIHGEGLRGGRTGARVDYLVIACAIWTISISVILAIYSYERHPHIQDEVGYLFNAQYFSHGLLGVAAPKIPESMEVFLIDCDAGRCISPMPPGWPAMLAIGSYFNVPWLVNPILAGINVVLIFLLLQLLYDRGTARLAVLLLAVSPWYIFMSMSFMTHIFSLTCALIAVISVVQLNRRKQYFWVIPAGLMVGLLAYTRPLESVMIASIIVLASLFIRGNRFRFTPFLLLLFSIILSVALVLPYNKIITGKYSEFPVMSYMNKVLGPGANSLGFGPEKGAAWGGMDPFPGHGLPDVMVNALLNLDAMNVELFGWSIGSLLPILLFFVIRGRNTLNYADKWFVSFFIMIFAFQSLYWFSGGPDFGARYYFLAIVPLVAITARAIRGLGYKANGSTTEISGMSAYGMIAVLALSISATSNFLPWRAIDKYHHYRGMRADLRELIADKKFKNALILINGKSQPDLSSALVYSSFFMNPDAPVIALNKGKDMQRRLAGAYPNRYFWFIDGPTRTGKGYQIVAGPVHASEIAK